MVSQSGCLFSFFFPFFLFLPFLAACALPLTPPPFSLSSYILRFRPFSLTLSPPPPPSLSRPHALISGSDLHTYRSPTSTGFITGHEFVGTIHSLDNNSPTLSSKFKIGDRVVSPFTTSCLQCQFCQEGLTGRCTKGALFGCKALEGGQAEYVRVPMAGEFATE